jgi:hypothetical protein
LAEFSKDIIASSWVKAFFRKFKCPELREDIIEEIVPINFVDVNVEDGFESLKAVRAFGHGRVVDRIAFVLVILESEDVSVAAQQIVYILLEQDCDSQFKLLVSPDCVSIVLHCFVQFSVLNIHSLHPESQLFAVKLIIHHFF